MGVLRDSRGRSNINSVTLVSVGQPCPTGRDVGLKKMINLFW